MAEVHEWTTRIQVSAFPPESKHARYYSVYVEWRGDGRYVVSNGFSEVLDTSGEWVWEPRRSERKADFIARTRYPLDEALRLAREAVPALEVNGYTADHWKRIEAEKEASRG